jgi:hypothetical protein
VKKLKRYLASPMPAVAAHRWNAGLAVTQPGIHNHKELNVFVIRVLCGMIQKLRVLQKYQIVLHYIKIPKRNGINLPINTFVIAKQDLYGMIQEQHVYCQRLTAIHIIKILWQYGTILLKNTCAIVLKVSCGIRQELNVFPIKFLTAIPIIKIR